jgi:hypothetical protein
LAVGACSYDTAARTQGGKAQRLPLLARIADGDFQRLDAAAFGVGSPFGRLVHGRGSGGTPLKAQRHGSPPSRSKGFDYQMPGKNDRCLSQRDSGIDANLVLSHSDSPSISGADMAPDPLPASLEAGSAVRVLLPGELLFRQGDPTAAIYKVESGSAASDPSHRR